MSHSHQPARAPMWARRSTPLDQQVRALALPAAAMIAVAATIALGTGLAIGHQAAIADGSAASAALSWFAVGAVAFVALSAMALTAVIIRNTAHAVGGTVAHTAVLIDRITAGDLAASIPPAAEGAEGEVHQALERLLRVMRRNAEMAEALAAGSFRRVVAVEAGDAVGVALSSVARYMEKSAAVAQRVARGDLGAVAAEPDVHDSLGQAHAAMVRQILSVMRDVAATKQAITATTVEMQREVEALVSGAAEDSDLLRRAADRVSQIALQAHASAERATTLEERSLEGAQLVRDGVTAAAQSMETLSDMMRGADAAQALARDAGLVAVRAASDVVSAAMRPELPEEEARELATRAAQVAGAMHRLRLVGSTAAGESQRVLDRIGDTVHDGRRVVRELSAVSRSHAAALLEIDEAVSDAHLTARRNVAAARQLAYRVESLSAHSRRLDGLLRRFQKGGVAAAPLGTVDMKGPVLYRTPTGSHDPQPRRELVAR